LCPSGAAYRPDVSHAVDVDSILVRFGDTVAVRDVSLRVDFGTIAVVLGPNGAGKTTTLETLLGFRKPQSGSIRVLGRDPVRDHRAVVASTGALLQRAGVWQPMTPRQCLRLTASYYPEPRSVDELIDVLGLTRCASTPWRRLSGGEQQRTLLALALLGRPRVLVLDEPTAGVDPEGHVVVRQVVRDERSRGCAIVLATHDLADAELLADTVTVIHRGTVRAFNTVESLRGSARLSFETSIRVDVGDLATALGATITEESPGHYVSSDATDGAVATLSSRLATLGVALVSLRTRATLEETYLALVSDEVEGST
jgi:ABC-2 type transport system ATP-binding protein